METIIRCKDIGYKCDFKAIGDNLSEAIKISARARAKDNIGSWEKNSQNKSRMELLKE